MTLNPNEGRRRRMAYNYLKIRVQLKLFEKLKFENWSFETYLRIEVLKFIWELKFWKLEFWKLNLKIGILENYSRMEVWKLEFWRIIWEWDFLKIKFESWNFGKLFEN